MSCSGSFASYFDRSKLVKSLGDFLERFDQTEPEEKVQTITHLELGEEDPITTVFERAINTPTPPESTTLDKNQQTKTSVAELITRRRRLHMTVKDLYQRINEDPSVKHVRLSTLFSINAGTASTKTVDTYYDSINTILNKALSEEKDETPTKRKRAREHTVSLEINKKACLDHVAARQLEDKAIFDKAAELERYRHSLEITRVELCKQIKEKLNVKLPISTLHNIETRTASTETINKHYDHIKKILDMAHIPKGED
jgi:hypothetical protein